MSERLQRAAEAAYQLDEEMSIFGKKSKKLNVCFPMVEENEMTFTIVPY